MNVNKDNFTKEIVHEDNEDDEFFTSREFNCAIENMGDGAGSKQAGEKKALIRGNIVPSRPEKPDTTGLSAEEAEDVIRHYNKDRKAYMDRQCGERHEQGNQLTSITFTGDLSPSLRLESVVKNR